MVAVPIISRTKKMSKSRTLSINRQQLILHYLMLCQQYEYSVRQEGCYEFQEVIIKSSNNKTFSLFSGFRLIWTTGEGSKKSKLPSGSGLIANTKDTWKVNADHTCTKAIVEKLVEDLSSHTLETLRTTTAELRLLTKLNAKNRRVISDCGAISLLVNLLNSTDAQVQENAVTALVNLSIDNNCKIIIAQANAIEALIHVLQTGSPEAKENSAATLGSLSVCEDNQVKIGRSGAIGPLVDLLRDGTPRGKKDAATALFNLSLLSENKAKIVEAGSIKHLVKLMDPAAGMVEKAVVVLANVASIDEGRIEIVREGGIPLLVDAVELGSARAKEYAAAALLWLCAISSRFCIMAIREGAVPPLVALSQSGTTRAKEKARALLGCFSRNKLV
ncbi:U-box domain-containing protein 4-like [Cucurbita pepo subsp. pepo]|uniref:U-box domain-containing protein 4-like n=1 Tax=Cucurbita pepo subsp. pepo TaxID=3664 RepID=UPI000C9D8681|nr:U-box domain-containing protein 4-like [Cucurbita pepo subsp. pepo]